MIKIIVDSTCDLPQDIIDKYDIKVLPLRVLLNDVEYLDRVDITVEEVYNEMRNGILPKTSQILPKDVYETFNRYCEEGNDFIYLAFSAALSGTCGLATTILEEFKEKYPKRKMAVIDSKSGATAIGLMALQAVKMVEQGYAYEDILNIMNEMIDSVEHLFVLDDLNWLMKGGRITKTQATLGTMLNLKPMLHIKDGRMEVIQKCRGRKKSLNSLVDVVEERIKEFPDQIIGIGHADDLETAEELISIIKKRLGDDKVFMENKIGCVLGSHLGIGGVGVLFFNKKPNIYLS